MHSLAFSKFVELDDKNSDAFVRVGNAELSKATGVTEKRLWQSTRTQSRLFLKPEREPVDVAVEMSRYLLHELGLGASGVAKCGGFGMCHTAVGEHDPQQLAEDVARKVGISAQNVVGISGGCAGFVGLLETVKERAQNMKDGEHFPVVNVESMERYIDMKDPKAGPLFAARATATSLWRGPGHPFLFAEWESVEPTYEPVPKDGYVFQYEAAEAHTFFADEPEQKQIVRMKGELAYNNGQHLITQAAADSKEHVQQHYGIQDVNFIAVPHQPNGRMLNAVAQFEGPRLNIRFVNGFEGMSNVISSTIPSVLSRIETLDVPELVDGAAVLIPAAGISMINEKREMSVARGAFVWKPGAYEAVAV